MISVNEIKSKLHLFGTLEDALIIFTITLSIIAVITLG